MKRRSNTANFMLGVAQIALGVLALVVVCLMLANAVMRPLEGRHGSPEAATGCQPVRVNALVTVPWHPPYRCVR